MGAFRTTFITDENGIVERIFTPKDIRVKAHAEQILG
jgi:peroxiredoxin Q/BCP